MIAGILLDPKVLEQNPVPHVRVYASSPLKRGIDLLLAIPGLAVLALVFIPVAITIKFSSRGPIFFRQMRLGLDGRSFQLVKFRTMRNPVNGEAWGERTAQHDPRVTAVGSMLRKSYLDELPQFWNVIRGSMSVVGPRPEIPVLARSIAARHPRFAHRLVVKPGITGLAQIYYRHADTGKDAWRRYYYDAFYMRQCSAGLDARIAMRTVIRMIRYRGQ